MYKVISILRASVLVVLLSTFTNASLVHADTGLCPSGYTEGLVSTGFVDCYDESGFVSKLADAQIDRIELEAVCLTVANAVVTRSDIVTSSSGSSFRAEVTCTVPRPNPPGTVLCPSGSDEAIRAFDTLVCEYFGNAAATMPAAQAMLALQTADCATNTGIVLDSSVSVLSVGVAETPFYFPSLACAIPIAAIDVILCPFRFHQVNPTTSTLITCDNDGEFFESLQEAQDGSLIDQNICTSTTAGLGAVTTVATFQTGSSMFGNRVTCEVKIPGYSDFVDQTIVRACDATCTEDVEQIRTCLNGGQPGGPGCVAPATQVIVKKCNTGTNSDGLCPLVVTPNAIVPLLLFDDDDD